MCRVTFLALLTGSSCCVLRAIAYTMGLQLLQLIYGSACVCPVKPSCREGLKPLKKWFVLVSLKVTLLCRLKCKSYWFVMHHVDSRSLLTPYSKAGTHPRGVAVPCEKGSIAVVPHPPMGAHLV